MLQHRLHTRRATCLLFSVSMLMGFSAHAAPCLKATVTGTHGGYEGTTIVGTDLVSLTLPRE